MKGSAARRGPPTATALHGSARSKHRRLGHPPREMQRCQLRVTEITERARYEPVDVVGPRTLVELVTNDRRNGRRREHLGGLAVRGTYDLEWCRLLLCRVNGEEGAELGDDASRRGGSRFGRLRLGADASIGGGVTPGVEQPLDLR